MSVSDEEYCWYCHQRITKCKCKSETPSPTGDRDCEELKKEVERLKGELDKLSRPVTKQ